MDVGRRRAKRRKQPSQQETNRSAKDIMNPWVLTVRDDMSAQELATFFTENEISGAPVVDGAGKLVGVVSLTDIARSAAETGELLSERSHPDFYLLGRTARLSVEELEQMQIENERLLVRDMMTPTLYTVSERASVSEVAQTMLTGHIHRLLVTRGRTVVGIITTMDLLKLLLDDT